MPTCTKNLEKFHAKSELRVRHSCLFPATSFISLQLLFFFTLDLNDVPKWSSRVTRHLRSPTRSRLSYQMASDDGAETEWPATLATLVVYDATVHFPAQDAYEVI